MRMGSTRRCFRGHMMRARDRDQRLLAGASSRIMARICMGTPLALRIARSCDGHFQR